MESLKCASLVLHIRIYRCQLRMKFEESYSINSVKRNYPSRLQKLFTNCKLIMFQQNFLKLWCRYEFNAHNNLWNSEIVLQWIQQKISRKVTETDSQTRLLNSITLTMCLPACRIPSNYTNTARTLLQNLMTFNFRAWFFKR